MKIESHLMGVNARGVGKPTDTKVFIDPRRIESITEGTVFDEEGNKVKVGTVVYLQSGDSKFIEMNFDITRELWEVYGEREGGVK